MNFESGGRRVTVMKHRVLAEVRNNGESHALTIYDGNEQREFTQVMSQGQPSMPPCLQYLHFILDRSVLKGLILTGGEVRLVPQTS